MENIKTDSHKSAQLIFDEGAKAIQQRKDSLFKGAGKLDIHEQKNEPLLNLPTYTTIN
jgi:hypothetical protein